MYMVYGQGRLCSDLSKYFFWRINKTEVFSLALCATGYKIFYSLKCHNWKATKIIYSFERTELKDLFISTTISVLSCIFKRKNRKLSQKLFYYLISIFWFNSLYAWGLKDVITITILLFLHLMLQCIYNIISC